MFLLDTFSLAKTYMSRKKDAWTVFSGPSCNPPTDPRMNDRGLAQLNQCVSTGSDSSHREAPGKVSGSILDLLDLGS